MDWRRSSNQGHTSRGSLWPHDGRCVPVGVLRRADEVDQSPPCPHPGHKAAEAGGAAFKQGGRIPVDLSGPAADRQRYIGEFYSSYFAWFNVAGLILQMFFVSCIFKAG